MKNRFRFSPIFFALLGLACAAASVFLVARSLQLPPYLIREPESAAACTQTLMDSICSGDYETARQQLQGAPELEMDRDPADPVGVLLKDAYMESCSYEFGGQCYASGTGLCRQVTFRSLDIAAVMEAVGPLAESLFQERIDNAEDQTMIYDESGNYREEFVRQALMDAAQQALKENYRLNETTLTLQLLYQDGQWLVAADQQLLKIIGGGIAG